MALALYRKYRPCTFAEVIGQEHVTGPLMQALRSGRLHHAYLFSGPRGCGKTSSARILARSLNCAEGPTPDPCGTCDSCLALAVDGPGSIDVIEIDAASHGGVDDARELRERAVFAPAASRFKVYIIDEAHMVTTGGFNALLKLVEEPPDYVTFIFATTEPEKVLGTIKSRTHHYPFRLIPPGVLRPYLDRLCREEAVPVEPMVFPLVVRAGGGSVRDSLSVLDQLIAGAGEEGVTYARAVALLGVTDVALIDEMTDALAAGDGATAFATIDRVAEAGHEPRRFTADLLERLRDLIVLQQVPDAAASGIIDAPADQLERMTAQATRIGPAALSRLADIAHCGLTEMRGTASPRLLLELIIARMLLPGAEDSTGALLQRLERMERRLGASSAGPATADATAAPHGEPASQSPATAAPTHAGPAQPAKPPPPHQPDRADQPGRPGRREPAATRAAPVQRPQPVAVAPLAATGLAGPGGAAASVPDSSGPPSAPEQTGPPADPGGLDVAAVRRVWDEVLTTAGRRSKRLAAIARDGIVRDLVGTTVVLQFKSTFHAKSVQADPEPVEQALHEVLGGVWQIRCVLAEDDKPGLFGAELPGRDAAPTPPPAAVIDQTRPTDQTEPEAGSTENGRRLAEPVEDGWPTPARPGRSGADGSPALGQPAGDGWPTPARADPAAGSPAAPASEGSDGTAGVRSGTAVAAGPAGPATGRSGAAKADGSGGARPKGPAGARASGKTVAPKSRQAKATATGAPAGTTVTAAPDGTANPPAGRAGRGTRARGLAAASPGTPSGDLDHHRGQAYPGFDPGDGPVDDEPAAGSRASGEQQAVQLFVDAFGAEKIGEVDHGPG